jgi:hypothetical protein
MSESYKFKSRIITIISFIVTILSYLTVDQILPYLPTSLKVFAPSIIALIGLLATQLSEEKRVIVAENLAKNDSVEISSTDYDTDEVA